MAAAALLLALHLGAAAAQLGDLELNPVTAVKNMPATIRGALRTFKRGTGEMWVNRKQAGVVRKRIKSGGPPAEYAELVLMRKSSEDTAKLLKAGFVWLAAPEVFPAMLFFFPRSLPSTFEDEQAALRRYATLRRMRTKAVLGLLCDLDDKAAAAGRKGVSGQAQAEVARRAMRGGGTNAIRPLESYTLPNAWEPSVVAKKPIRGIPGYALKAGCTLIGSNFPMPPFMRAARLREHLQNLVAEDAVLSNTDLRTLSRSELLEACFDRGLGDTSNSENEMRSQLGRWLDLTSESRMSAGFGKPNPERLRLAAMAVCAVASCRDDREQLPRLLYAP